ncbi:MAG: DNA repair protein RecO [Verrucomicrobia bacterium]|nr:DNA repair protein RecO [Verrucomicrobiota bacterium]
MDERTTGLILRTRPLTETSLIVHWLTRDFGRLATVAKGARRPKSPFQGKLDLFYVADLSFVRSRRSELHTLREVVLRETHPALRTDLSLLQQAAYSVALIEQTTECDTPLKEIFQLLENFLRHLPLPPPLARTVFAFEIKLLAELGLKPDFTASKLTPGARRLLEKFLSDDWPALLPVKLSAAQNQELSRFLRGFLQEHLGTVPRGRDAALELS